jgi:hypothetical protein
VKALYPFVLQAAEAETDEEKRRLLVAALTVSAVPEGPLYGEEIACPLFDAIDAAEARATHQKVVR